MNETVVVVWTTSVVVKVETAMRLARAVDVEIKARAADGVDRTVDEVDNAEADETDCAPNDRLERAVDEVDNAEADDTDCSPNDRLERAVDVDDVAEDVTDSAAAERVDDEAE